MRTRLAAFALVATAFAAGTAFADLAGDFKVLKKSYEELSRKRPVAMQRAFSLIHPGRKFLVDRKFDRNGGPERLHMARHLAAGRQRHAVGLAGDAEVGIIGERGKYPYTRDRFVITQCLKLIVAHHRAG